MLHLRSLVPPSSLCAQWQFHAVLRLPPELRQVALRSFCTTTPALHPFRSRDDPTFVDEGDSTSSPEISRDVPLDGIVTSRDRDRHRRSLQRHGSEGQLGNIRRQQLQPQKQSKGVMNQNTFRIHKIYTKGLPIADRLATLKWRLLRSLNVPNAPMIQQEVEALEAALRASPQPAPTDSGLPQLQSSEGEYDTIGGAPRSEGIVRRSPVTSDADVAITTPATSDEEVAITTLASDTSTPATPTHFTSNTKSEVNTPDFSIVKDLILQTQELTAVLKVFVTQQAQAAQPHAIPSTNVLSQAVQDFSNPVAIPPSGSSRYQSMQNPSDERAKPIEFASLPHELDIEDVSKTAGSSVEILDKPSDTLPTSGLSIDPTPPPGIGMLYEKLFPEQASQTLQPTVANESIPRLPLSIDAASALEQTKNMPLSKSEQLAELYDSQEVRKRSVLILRNVSKTLTEDDFRRAMPRGKHLQEWTQRGKYERVIPIRNFWTLDRIGDYWIIFKDQHTADVFKEHVKKIHNLAKEYTPSSLLSSLRPANQTSSADGAEDEAELVRNFTLLAPSMPLILERAAAIRDVVFNTGGYPQALPGGLTPETPQVVLRLEGGNRPNWYQVRDAIFQDGSRQGITWNLLPGELAIRRLEMEPSSQDQLDLEKASGIDDDSADWRNQLAHNGTNDASILAQDRLDQGHHGQRWVIAFKERADAQRFVRLWHMRDFPWTKDDMKRDLFFKGITRVKAELLW